MVLAACDRLASIPNSPEQTPESWLIIQPFVQVKIGAVEFILVQPSSTIFIYLFGFIAIGLGIYFFRIRGHQQSRLWWGIAMSLWGIGALFAGTSYQAFSYEIKCAGQAICSWTSWWEVLYLLFSAASVDALMVAEAVSCCTGKWRKGMIAYAYLNFGLYFIAVLVGVLTLNRFLISFELLMIATVPSIVVFLILNTWRYGKYKEGLDLALLFTWFWLGITFGGYFLYLILDISNKLWEKGIWFSENDILHIGLILWMVIIARYVAPQVADKNHLKPDNT